MHQKLLETLAEAPHGTGPLSVQVFTALGGMIRREPTSRQGGRIVAYCFWPGEIEPCMDHLLATSLNDITRYVDRYHRDWTVMKLDHTHYAATIDATWMFKAATPALALCGAAVRARAKRVSWMPEDLRPAHEPPAARGADA